MSSFENFQVTNSIFILVSCMFPPIVLWFPLFIFLSKSPHAILLLRSTRTLFKSLGVSLLYKGKNYYKNNFSDAFSRVVFLNPLLC